MKLRVLTYNIHKGFDLGNRNSVLENIRKGIRQSEADLVFIQELQDENKLNPHLIQQSQLEYLADGVWEHFKYGKNAVYENGHHGNALLSRFPVTSFENLDISTNKWESRGLLFAEIDLGTGVKMDVFNTHLNLFHASRLVQKTKIVDFVKSKTSQKNPVIMAGDFNDWNRKLSPHFINELGLFEAFQLHSRDFAKTFPSTFPVLSLDRIFFKGIQCETAQVLRGDPWSKLSDHLALFAIFDL